MDIKKREELLLQFWEKDRPQYAAFNRDGMIDAEVWQQTDVHIVFVFKEMPGLDGDLRRIILDNPDRAYTRIRANLARWIHIMLYHEYLEIMPEEYVQALLRKVCIVNLKKEADIQKTGRDDIWTCTSQDKRFIRKQIALYQPDYVVICGFEWIAELVHDVVLETNSRWKHNVNKIHYFNSWIGGSNQKVTAINMPHPRNASRIWSRQLQELMQTLGAGGSDRPTQTLFHQQHGDAYNTFIG
ncbi:MAG: hypothetical protein ACRDBO_08710 [Lachnospiraceae bacterium]